VAEQICIAIDGPASSGKGTVARTVAKALGFAYIDTGAMYRSVALLAEDGGVDWTDEGGLADLIERLRFDFLWDGDELRIVVNGHDISERIRMQRIGQGASDVATLSGVRAGLVERQRALAEGGAIVMDGRDIGTVVLPQARLKIYLDASVAERAKRRFLELQQRGQNVSLSQVEAEVLARDNQDKNRAVSPLRQAHDAVYIDSTSLNSEQAAQKIVELVHSIA
jgi:cytidylate kinase